MAKTDFNTVVLFILIILNIFLSSQPVFAMDNQKIKQLKKELYSFSHKWIKKVQKHLNYTKNHPKIKKNKDNSYTLEYSQIAPTSLQTNVKQHQKTYLGIVKYKEVIYRASAKNKNDLKQIQATPVKVRHITEIFRYTPNGWK